MGKIKLTNKKQNFQFGHYGDDHTISVLTPDDYQNTKNRQRDLQFRCIAEYDNVSKNGGSCFFCTLTFNNRHLRKVIRQSTFYRQTEDKIEWKVTDKLISVGTLRDIQLFNKKLRKKLLEEYDCTYKYIFCQEYGKSDEYIDEHGRKRIGTARPHWHFNAFLSKAIDNETFQKLVDECWTSTTYDYVPLYTQDGKPRKHRDGTPITQRVQHNHSIGRTKDLLLYGDVEAAISYVTKYVTKDVTLQDKRFQPHEKGFTFLDSIFCDPDTGEVIPINEICPRVLTSTNLGDSYVHKFPSLGKDSCPLIDEGKFISGQHPLRLKNNNISINIPLPRYYFRKYCKIVEYKDVDTLSTSKTFNNSKPVTLLEIFDQTECDFIDTKSFTSDSKFYLRFKHMLVSNNAIRSVDAFRPWAILNGLPNYDHYMLKKYFELRFKLFKFRDNGETTICRICEHSPYYAELEHNILLYEVECEQKRLDHLDVIRARDIQRKNNNHNSPSNPWRNG